jgi:ligand-binding sensor domain-containing protein/two-component sensor histidine kinase
MTDFHAKPRVPGVGPFFLWLLGTGARAYFLGLVLLFAPIPWAEQRVVAQTQPSAKLAIGHDFWGMKENAPQGATGLAQTSDGFLWLGTATGLYRFDGIRFELFHSPFGDQLLSTNIFALFAPPSGGLWIGYTFGGFSFLINGRITNYSETGSATGTVRNFAQDANGVLWAATTSGLWKFDTPHWQHIGPESDAPAGPIIEARFDQDGTLWALAGTPNASNQVTKLAYLRPGSSNFQTVAIDLFVPGFTLDADGRAVTSPGSKQLFDKSRDDSDDLPSAYPVLRNRSTQIVDRAKSVWIITEGPIVLRLDSPLGRLPDALGNASPRNSETYHLNANNTAKLVDREGNIWFGEPNGVDRFFYSPLIRQELPNEPYFTLAPDEDGAIRISAGNFGSPATSFCLVTDGKVQLRKAPGGLVGFSYRSPDKTLWLGGDGGLWRLAGADLIRIDLPNEMVDQASFLQTITEDRQGGMWVSFGRHGLYRLADGVWTPYGGHEDLPKAGVVIEFTDSLGRVWFGYTKGQLAVLDGDHVQVFGPNDGIRVGNITAISGRGPEIWIGGEFGLQQFDHGRFHNIQATDGELLRGISGIVETANGDLWLNGLGGILHVRRSEIAEALKNSAYQVKGEHFGMREGLPGFPFQLRPLNTAIEGTDRRLWFATNGGVVWLDPARPENNVPQPPITIQSVSADDKNYLVGSAPKFPAHTSSVQISYAAISLSDPTDVHFRYKLQESDRDWHEATGASPVSYRHLAPGAYHFSVMATDTNGVWSDKVITTEFSILPAFYQTRWFLALCAAAVLTVLYLFYLLRIRQVAHQFQIRMDERVNERTRIARELHDTLLQTFQALLLHLQSVFNALPELPANDKAKHKLNSVIDQAERAVTEGRDAVQGLRSSTMLSSDLAAALDTIGAELATLNGNQDVPAFHAEVEGTPRELKLVLRDEIFRIVGEALRNAFRHAHALHIEVALRYDEQQLTVVVRDDGQGISAEILEAKGRAGHWGLPGMRERAGKVGAQLELKSQPGAGTEVKLTIPAAAAYQSRSAWRELVLLRARPLTSIPKANSR